MLQKDVRTPKYDGMPSSSMCVLDDVELATG